MTPHAVGIPAAHVLLSGIGGVLLGIVLLWASGVSSAWMLVVAGTGLLPLLFVGLGSMTRVLQALLILSLSMNLDVFLGYSERFQQIRPGVPITFTAVVLLCLYANALVGATTDRVSLFRVPVPVIVPFVVLVAWAALSVGVAVQPGFVFQALPGYVTAFLTCLYAIQLMRGEREIGFTIQCVAVAVAVGGSVGIVQYVTGGWPSLSLLGGREADVVQEYAGGGLSRVSGLLRHPNTFAVYLNGFLPLLLAVALLPARGARRVLCATAFSLGLVALVLTYSRGGWMAFVVSLVILLVVIPKRSWRPGFGTTLLALATVSAVVIVLAVTPLYQRVTTRLTADDQGAARSRIALAAAGLDIIAQHPVRGVGLGNYKFQSPVVVDERGVWLIEPGDGMPMRVHNLVLLTAAELGLPGALLLVSILALFFVRATTAIRHGDEFRSRVALGVTCGLVASLMHGMFEPMTLADSNALILVFLGGCATGLGDRRGER